MADTANRPDLDIDRDGDGIAENDPLAQLAFLMGDAPAASLRSERVRPADETPDDNVEPDAASAGLDDTDYEYAEQLSAESDLEETLMAELVADAPAPDAVESHTQSEPTESVSEPDLDVDVSSDNFSGIENDFSSGIENVSTYSEPHGERASVEAPGMSLEDELQALLGGTVEVADVVEAPIEAPLPEDTFAVDAEEFAEEKISDDGSAEEDWSHTPEVELSSEADLEVPDFPLAQEAHYADAETGDTPSQEEPTLQLSVPSDNDHVASDFVDDREMPKPFFAPLEDDVAELEDTGSALHGFENFESSEAEITLAEEPFVEDTYASQDHVSDEPTNSDPSYVAAAGVASAGFVAASLSRGNQAEFAEHSDGETPDFDLDDTPDHSAEVSTSAAHSTYDDTFSDFDAALEDDFSQLFDEEIAASSSSNPIQQSPVVSATDPVHAEISPLDELEALMLDDGPLLGSADAALGAPPTLDTVDMSSFEKPSAAAYDLPHHEAPSAVAGTAAKADDDLDLDFDFGDLDTSLAAGAGAAAMAATGRKSTAAGGDFDEAFSETAFEAELARDIEFVKHDRSATSAKDMPLYDNASKGFSDSKPNRRGLFIGGAVGALALLGAVGIYAVGSGDAVIDDAPMLVSADPEPVKVAPEEPGGDQVPNQDRAVFGADEGQAPATTQETLVTTSEEPVDIATAPGLTEGSPDGEKVSDRLAEETEALTQTEEGNRNNGLTTPRRVRTLVVRPDGSLAEKPAAPEPAPVVETAAAAPETEIAAVTAVEGSVATGQDDSQAIAPTAEVPQGEGGINLPATTVPERVATATQVPETTQPAIPVRTVTTSTITPPVIRDRPADQPVNIVNAQPQRPAPATQVAVAPQEPAPVAPVASSSSSAFAVQISSQTSRDAAQQSAANLVSRYRNLLGGRDISIQEARIEGKGTYYRVRVGAASSAEATQLCENYKRAGGNCFVAR